MTNLLLLGVPSPTELFVILVVILVLFVLLRVPGAAKQTGETYGMLESAFKFVREKLSK